MNRRQLRDALASGGLSLIVKPKEAEKDARIAELEAIAQRWKRETEQVNLRVAHAEAEAARLREAVTKARFDLLRTGGAIKMSPDAARSFAAEGMAACDAALAALQGSAPK